MHRVVITGTGIVSPIGNGCASFWSALCAGQSGIAWREFLPPHWPALADGSHQRILVGQVPTLDERHAFGELSPEFLDPYARFALVAAREALASANLLHPDNRPFPSERFACIVGSAVGGDLAHGMSGFRAYAERKRPMPTTIPRVMVNSAASAISIVHALRGPTFATASACSSGTHAIGLAFDFIRRGIVDLALCGGSDSLPPYSTYQCWRQLRVLSPRACSPFAPHRDGMVIGEGAGILILEPLDSARARGAAIFGEILGYAANSDAFDMVQPSPAGMAACIRAALLDAQLSPEAIGLISAHGTGTRLNDQAEAAVLQQLFGSGSQAPLVHASKAWLGHALGGAGVQETIAALLMLRNAWVPPQPADPDAGSQPPLVNFPPAGGAALHPTLALKTSFAFGGLNAALILAPPPVT